MKRSSKRMPHIFQEHGSLLAQWHSQNFLFTRETHNLVCIPFVHLILFSGARTLRSNHFATIPGSIFSLTSLTFLFVLSGKILETCTQRDILRQSSYCSANEYWKTHEISQHAQKENQKYFYEFPCSEKKLFTRTSYWDRSLYETHNTFYGMLKLCGI